ncbi:hypothetical protein [Yokenella regensburgei]|uniref:hypothetical protein n=1 Tax=Yokenella regensburgei TaxID=158877 RepID=UPI003EDA0413
MYATTKEKSKSLLSSSTSDRGESSHEHEKLTASLPKVSKDQKNSFGLYDIHKDGWYVQEPRPVFMESDKAAGKLDLTNVLAIVHGIKIQFSEKALDDGFLRSAYARLGPNPEGYSRDADRNGGGALAVYTRAVSRPGSAKWKAQGMGVGSGEGTVQFVIKPDILLDPNHIWRASGTDNMGMPPGAKKTDKLNSFERWQRQSEAGRNSAFTGSVGPKPVENNEQLHWEKLPLEGLKAIIIRKSEDVPQSLAEVSEGLQVPILFSLPGESLKQVLLKNGLVDKDGKWIDLTH